MSICQFQREIRKTPNGVGSSGGFSCHGCRRKGTGRCKQLFYLVGEALGRQISLLDAPRTTRFGQPPSVVELIVVEGMW